MQQSIDIRLTVAHAKESWAQQESPFIELLRHGSLTVEFYQPRLVDKQQPHSRDEIYVVVSGTGEFINGTCRQRFEPGEVLFVPAGVEYRFENFSEDFATWVFFYGPKGGEAPSGP
ncbi:cupin [Leptolyngbya sp. Heron Island J]|uniref:cupin domain-containing protein n=1 Tax=Leptolyngbya sp. Heron Island J TaxID=1385935 RepID=UPI0003B93F3C|nr:cupin domain-containing protein [Leptolyngbya sp. Heron Island J]ESA33479.1 cupin [Leptolyngbya sp. Heron Island J]